MMTSKALAACSQTDHQCSAAVLRECLEQLLPAAGGGPQRAAQLTTLVTSQWLPSGKRAFWKASSSWQSCHTLSAVGKAVTQRLVHNTGRSISCRKALHEALIRLASLCHRDGRRPADFSCCLIGPTQSLQELHCLASRQKGVKLDHRARNSGPGRGPHLTQQDASESTLTALCC